MMQAIESPSMSIGMLNRFKPGVSKAILEAMIAEVALFFNVGKNLTPVQIGQTIELILGDVEFRNLKPEDLKVMFDNAKKGLYGKTFDRLDGQIIFEWKNAYMAERMALCEQISIKEHNQVKKESNLITPAMAEYYGEILKNIKKAAEETAATVVPEPKRPREKTPREQLIQLLFNEFDEIHKQRHGIVDGIRFLEVDDIEDGKPVKRMVDQVEYVEFMLPKVYENL